MATSLLHGARRKGAKQFQEDTFFTFSSPDCRFIAAGVFDGHGGEHGKVASEVASQVCQRFFEQNWQTTLSFSDDEWKKEFRRLFEQCHNQIRTSFVTPSSADQSSSANNDDRPFVDTSNRFGVVRRTSNRYPIHGGTTASVVVIHQQDESQGGGVTVVSANAGDSDAIFFPKLAVSPGSKIAACQHISVDHGPDSATEFARLQSLPASEYPQKLLFVYDQQSVYRKYECPAVFLPDGTKDPVFVKNPWGHDLRPTNVRYDAAVYAVTPRDVPRDTTCIAMTRSLGDFYAQQFGLTHEPDTNVVRLAPSEFRNGQHFHVSLASDGIWDSWKFDEHAKFINQLIDEHDGDLVRATEHALQDSVDKAIANFGRAHYDDASQVIMRVALLNHGGK